MDRAGMAIEIFPSKLGTKSEAFRYTKNFSNIQVIHANERQPFIQVKSSTQSSHYCKCEQHQ